MTTSTHNQMHKGSNGRPPGESPPPWGWSGVGIIALSVVYWLWGRGTDSLLPSATPKAKAVASSSGRPSPRANLMLPGGATIFLKEGSPSRTLAKFLADNDDVVVPRTFAFDGGHFPLGTSVLTPKAEQIVKDLSTILAAYPTTTLQVQGYADDLDNVDANRALALGRAEMVKHALVNRGIAGSRLTMTDGRQEQLLTFNNTEDKQNTNRHLVVVVMTK